jgi:CheY-like chemotaxis protein
VSEPSVINLLVVDRAKADIEHIVKTLRGNDYQVELTEADAGEAARNAIDYQPLDLVLLRVAEGLPTVAEIRLMVAESGQAIPLIALVDESAQQQHKPAHLLFEGADNFAPLADADHLLAVIRKELEQARLAADRRIL